MIHELVYDVRQPLLGGAHFSLPLEDTYKSSFWSLVLTLSDFQESFIDLGGGEARQLNFIGRQKLIEFCDVTKLARSSSAGTMANIATNRPSLFNQFLDAIFNEF